MMKGRLIVDANEIALSISQIFGGYEVKDEHLDSDKNQMTVPDVPIEKLNLSVRSYNALKRNHIDKLSQLVLCTEEKLFGFRNMGVKSVTEIMDKVPAYLAEHSMTELQYEQMKENPPSKILPQLTGTIDLPEADEDILTLASDYSVVNGVIVHRESLRMIQNTDIAMLSLSVRAYNCLKRGGMTTIAALIGMPFEDLKSIKNLGVKSAMEIQEKLEAYLSEEVASSFMTIEAYEHTRSSDENSEEGEDDALFIRCTPAIIKRLYANEPFVNLSYEEVAEQLSKTVDKESIQLTLDTMVKNGELVLQDGSYGMAYESFYEYLQREGDKVEKQIEATQRMVRILQCRAEGKTLEEIGEIEGISRERIRQIVSKGIKRFLDTTKVFTEDQYKYLFEQYDLEKEFYLDRFDNGNRLWYYLNARYEQGSRDPMEEALEDQNLSVHLRRIIEDWVYDGYVKIDGKYIKAQRSLIEDYILAIKCKDEVTLDTFYKYYEEFLEEYNITDENLLLTEQVMRTRSNRLADSQCVLWKQNQRLRYYDIAGGDYKELLDTLNLAQYEDVEISTRKFMLLYPELMKCYDIRDEYELHNLLKKIHAESENPKMEFGRMPTLKFGEFDRDAAVKAMLFALAPIDAEDLAEALATEYGHRKETIMANWLDCITGYYHQGMYSIAYEDLPEDHVELLKQHLTDDFYYLTEIRKIYKSLFDNADTTLISTYNLKKMGFVVNSTYAIQNYPSAAAYFEHLLLDPDVVDTASISKRLTGIVAYSPVLSRLKHDKTIIEFEPYQYINIRRLEKLGIGKGQLERYADQVWSFLTDDSYFSIRSIRKEGFTAQLDDLGFGELFYASILKEDERFGWQKVGNTVIFNPISKEFITQDFLVDLIKRKGSWDLDDFVNYLEDTYGVLMDRDDVRQKTKGSDIYYDRIMDKLYADYETYFEEI